jgi:hypothetical protein
VLTAPLFVWFTVKNDKDMVSIEEFGNILKWFGPMEAGSDEQHNFLIGVCDASLTRCTYICVLTSFMLLLLLDAKLIYQTMVSR